MAQTRRGAVSAGEPVIELETEKVNMEVVAPADGVLRAIAKRKVTRSPSARCWLSWLKARPCRQRG